MMLCQVRESGIFVRQRICKLSCFLYLCVYVSVCACHSYQAAFLPSGLSFLVIVLACAVHNDDDDNGSDVRVRDEPL